MTNMRMRIKGLTKEIESDPDDPILRRELIASLITEGLINRATHQMSKALKELEKKLLLPEKFYKPLIKTFISQGEIKPIEMLVRDLELNYDVELDEPIKRMVRKGRRAIRDASYGSAFPEDMKEEEWWNGPHLVSETNLVEWLPGRIIKVEDGVASVMLMCHDEDNGLEVELSEMPVEDIKSIATNWDGKLVNRCLEMGIYRSLDAVCVTFHRPEKT